VPNELEKKYGLCHSFLSGEFDKMLSKIDELLTMPELKKEWQNRRKKMLGEKIDVTAFWVWFVENYPNSIHMMKMDSEYQNRFK
jgi:predicted glycosyltransferase